MNRKAQIFSFMIAFGVVIICGFALFRFLTIKPEVESMLIAPANLLELYQSEQEFGFFIREAGKLAVVNAYSRIAKDGTFASEGAMMFNEYIKFDGLNPDIDEEFSSLIRENLDKFIQQADSEFKSIDYEIEILDGGINFKSDKKKISIDNENSGYSATHEFNPSFSLTLAELNLVDFSEIDDKYKGCKNKETMGEIEDCMEDLKNFDVKVSRPQDKTLFDLASKKRFFFESDSGIVYEGIKIKFSS